MTKIKLFGILFLFSVLISACERVAPNFIGVLQENYGQNGKSDFTLVKGKVNTAGPGTELFQVPMYEQRAKFDSVMHLQDADRTEYTSLPSYTYKIEEDSAVSVVFQNRRLGSGDAFMSALEDNVLQPLIYDIVKDAIRDSKTDSLTSSGASMKFENRVKKLVIDGFRSKGIKLITFTLPLIPSAKVRAKIDTRSEVNTNITVLDQKILEQKKTNELEELKTQQNLIRSKGLTPQILQEQLIDAWIQTKQPIYGGTPSLMIK